MALSPQDAAAVQKAAQAGGAPAGAGTQAVNAAGGVQQNTVTSAASNSTDPFISQLQQKLLGQSDIISSTNTALEDKIGAAIKGVQQSAQLGDQATASAFDRQKGYAQDQAQFATTQQLEGRSGFATNITALRQLVGNTDKQLNDLEQRKQELILQNDSAAASKVADLQLQAMSFRQQAQQQVFSNLLGMGNFAQQQAQMKQQADQFSRSQGFAESQAISQVALKYGLQVGPGETLDSITTKAMPFASQEEQLQLSQFRSQIAANNAQTQKAISDIQANKPLDATTLASLGSAMLTNPNMVMNVVKTTNQLGQVLGAAQSAAFKDAPSNIQTAITAGKSLDETKNDILSSSYLSVDQKKTLVSAAEEAYKTGNVPSSLGTAFGKGLPQGAAAFGAGYSDIVNNVLGWATGLGPIQK